MRRIAIAFAIVVVLGAAVAWVTRARPIPVALREVAEGKVEATLANTRAGTVEACQRTKLSTIIGGRIEYLGVKEGDRVRKGQLLLKLWNDDQHAQAALSQAQVALAARRVEEVCIAAVNAEKEAKRQAELRAKGFVSASREEIARTEAEVKRAACNTAKADVAQAEAKLKATRVEQGRVALLGAGPASLACAHELRRRGHGCTVYEKRPVVGGLNSTGVAPYKMKADRAATEVDWVLGIGGIDVVTGTYRPWEPAPLLSNSFGFGGHNGSLIISPS